MELDYIFDKDEEEIRAFEYSMVIPKLKETLDFLDGADRKKIMEVIDRYESALKNFNFRNLKCLNPTKTELGTISSTFIRIVLTQYGLGISGGSEKLKERIKSTKIDDEVVAGKILLSRRDTNYYSRSPLEKHVNDHLNQRMLKNFQEQHKEFINNNLI